MRMSRAASGAESVRTYVLGEHRVQRDDATAAAGSPQVIFAGTVDTADVTSTDLRATLATAPYLTVVDQYFAEPSEGIVSDFTFSAAPTDDEVIPTYTVDTYGIPIDVAGLVVLVLAGPDGAVVAPDRPAPPGGSGLKGLPAERTPVGRCYGPDSWPTHRTRCHPPGDRPGRSTGPPCTSRIRRSRPSTRDSRSCGSGSPSYSGCGPAAAGSEGPVWFGDGRYLLFSDIPNNRMLRWSEETGEVTVFRAPSNNSNGNTRDRQGRLVTCEHLTRRVTRTEHDGSASPCWWTATTASR